MRRYINIVPQSHEDNRAKTRKQNFESLSDMISLLGFPQSTIKKRVEQCVRPLFCRSRGHNYQVLDLTLLEVLADNRQYGINKSFVANV